MGQMDFISSIVSRFIFFANLSGKNFTDNVF